MKLCSSQLFYLKSFKVSNNFFLKKRKKTFLSALALGKEIQNIKKRKKSLSSARSRALGKDLNSNFTNDFG